MKPIDVKVRQVGNSLVISLPQRILEVFQIKAGQVVEMVAFKGRVTIRKGSRRIK